MAKVLAVVQGMKREITVNYSSSDGRNYATFKQSNIDGRISVTAPKDYTLKDIVDLMGETTRILSPKSVKILGKTVSLKDEILEEVLRSHKSVIRERFNHWLKIFSDNNDIPCNPDSVRLIIRDSQNKWGHCSKNKVICISLRSLMSPMKSLDYLIIHELCHLTHFHHEDIFWKMVQKYDPNYTVNRGNLGSGFKL